MVSRQDLVTNLLHDRITSVKVGIIINGVDGISPAEIVKNLAHSIGHKVYAVIVGYGDVSQTETEEFTISPRIESAVEWRNTPACAGSIPD